MDNLGPANFTVIERLSSLRSKLYCHNPVETTESGLTERCPLFRVSFKRGFTIHNIIYGLSHNLIMTMHSSPFSSVCWLSAFRTVVRSFPKVQHLG